MGNEKNILIILLIFSIFIFSFGYIAASEVSGSTYNISGYVFDNFGLGLGGVNVVQVENVSNTAITSTSGYYLITGMPNGTYNFSYSKSGFGTGNLEVTINDADKDGANISIFDLTPPGQVTGLVNDTPTQTSVNLSWNSLVDANYYQVFRNSSSLGFTKNTFWSDNGLNPSTLYIYWVSANDSYNNWGADSSVLSIVTSAVPDTALPTVTITSTAASPTKNSSIPITATFSEDVTGFSVSDINVGNGAASNFAAVSGTVYTFDVTPSGQGTVTVNIPAGAAQDAAGNGNTAATQFSIIYDSNPPTVTITSPSNNSTLNTSSVAVSGTASGTGSGMQKVEVSVDGSAFAPATGTTSWSFTTSTLSGGTHTITARATDDAGNTAETSVTVISDTTPPVIAITDPADGGIFNTSSITVSGTASDARLDKVEVKVGSGGWQTASGTTSWSLQVTLSEGSNTISARATDTAGNTKEASIDVISDTASPTVIISSPSNNSVLNTATIAVSGTASDAGSGVQKVGVSVDGGAFATVTGTSSWSYTTSALSDGTHTITARATDNAGNTKETSIKVISDTTPPAIAITSPADGETFNTSSIIVSGTASDARLDKVEVKVGSGGWQTASGTTSWSLQVTLSEGSNTISARATDTAGNIKEASINIISDTAPPAIAITSPANGTVFTTTSPITVSGTASDDRLGKVEVKVGNGAWQTASGTPTSWSIQVTLAEGSNLISARATDTAGNAKEASINVTRDTTPPASVTNANPYTGNFYINNSWVNPTDQDLSSIWFKYSDGTPLQNVSAPTNYLNLSKQPHYIQNISAQTVDSNGNINQTKVWFNATIPNNPIQITNVSDNYTLWEGQTLYIHAIWVDLDGDFAKGRIQPHYRPDNSTFDRGCDDCSSGYGIFNWTTVEGDRGNYTDFYLDIEDGYDNTRTIKYINITVLNSTPGTPTDLSRTTGNFWINNTWKGVNSDKFNVLHNGTWYNGSTDSYFNRSVGPHGWSNITVYGWNSYLRKTSSTGASQNTQVPNNIPSVPVRVAPLNGPNFADRNVTLSWSASSDVDGDTLTYDWQVSDQAVFSNIVKSGNSGQNLSSDVYLSPGNYYWRVRANDSMGVSDWSVQSSAPDFKIMAAPTITNIKAIILNETSAKIEWVTDQGDSRNRVQYGYSPTLSDSTSNWTNNTNKPSFTLTGLQGKSIYYQVFSYNSTNSTAFSNSSIFDVYPLKFSIKFIEPGITSDGNETWLNAHVGHVGKFIGVDGTFRNMGPDPLDLSITELYNNESSNWVAFRPLAPGENLSYMQVFGRPAFEINSSGVRDNLFNFTFGINISVNGYTSYNNSTTISLPLIPIFKIKRANADIVVVATGQKTDITYTIEANSSVNLTKVNIYDCNPSNTSDPCHSWDYSTLEANKPIIVNYPYSATTEDLFYNRCEESKLTNGSYQCIINLARFTGYNSTGGMITDTDYVEIRVCPITGCGDLIIPERKPNTGSGGANGNNNYVTGGGSQAPGGGGGGAPGSGEDFENIQSREVRGMNTLAFTSTAYVFTSSEPVMVVSFVSSVTANDVPVAVEVLKNRSKFIDTEAPGNLYKYFNVNVGSFRSKIGNGVVVYRVNNSWFEENDLEPKDVNIYKWVDGTWVEKNTQIVESKPNYTYFASLVGNFSSFAIAGGKKSDAASGQIAINAVPSEESVINPISEKSTASQQKSANLNTFKLPFNMPNIPIMFVLIFGMGLVIIAVAYRVKNNTINLKNFGYFNNMLSTTWLNGLWKDDRNKLYSWITSSFSVVKTKHFSRQGTYNLLKAVLLFVSILVIVSIIKYLPIERLSLPASNQWIIFIVTLAIGQILIAFIYFKNKKNMNAISRSRPALSSDYVSRKPSFKNPGLSIINLKNHIKMDSNSLIKSGLLIVLLLIIALIIYFRPLPVESLKLPIVFIIIFGIGQLLVLIIYFKNKKNKTI